MTDRFAVLIDHVAVVVIV